jgi:hypothetical protein
LSLLKKDIWYDFGDNIFSVGKELRIRVVNYQDKVLNYLRDLSIESFSFNINHISKIEEMKLIKDTKEKRNKYINREKFDLNSFSLPVLEKSLYITQKKILSNLEERIEEVQSNKMQCFGLVKFREFEKKNISQETSPSNSSKKSKKKQQTNRLLREIDFNTTQLKTCTKYKKSRRIESLTNKEFLKHKRKITLVKSTYKDL